MILVLNKMVSLFVQATRSTCVSLSFTCSSLLLSFFSRLVWGFWISSQGASNRSQSMRERSGACANSRQGLEPHLWAVSCRLLGPFLLMQDPGPSSQTAEWHAGLQVQPITPSSGRPGQIIATVIGEPDPACDQHTGHHAIPHQARPAGKGFLSRQPWLPGHLSYRPSSIWAQSMKSNFKLENI